MNERPRTVVFAYSEVGHRCLGALIRSGANIRGVFTYKDDPGENTWFGSVAELAEENGIPVFTDVDLKSTGGGQLVRELDPEILFSFYYRDMIPRSILEIPRLGAFNMHGSLLPKYRGRACVNWAIIHGETETGPTLHWMTVRPDEGDIVDQEKVSIEPEDTAMTVMLKIAGAAETILLRNLTLIEAGKAPRTPQDHSRATYFGGRKPEDGRLDWNATAKEICDLVRAVTHPYPGAFTDIFGDRMFIWKATPLEDDTVHPPGTTISREPLVIAAGKGAVRVDEKSQERNG
ncbi:MAG TPA: formyltransferase [Synergistales bacterium]|jgi:methionyl-tRNA formyltransferase|nr:formyltransferase [Synergistales bacterium]HRV71543.1 formyltransferase [Thermovirgaceae bacterium]